MECVYWYRYEEYLMIVQKVWKNKELYIYSNIHRHVHLTKFVCRLSLVLLEEVLITV